MGSSTQPWGPAHIQVAQHSVRGSSTHSGGPAASHGVQHPVVRSSTNPGGPVASHGVQHSCSSQLWGPAPGQASPCERGCLGGGRTPSLPVFWRGQARTNDPHGVVAAGGSKGSRDEGSTATPSTPSPPWPKPPLSFQSPRRGMGMPAPPHTPALGASSPGTTGLPWSHQTCSAPETQVFGVEGTFRDHPAHPPPWAGTSPARSGCPKPQPA